MNHWSIVTEMLRFHKYFCRHESDFLLEYDKGAYFWGGFIDAATQILGIGSLHFFTHHNATWQLFLHCSEDSLPTMSPCCFDEGLVLDELERKVKHTFLFLFQVTMCDIFTVSFVFEQLGVWGSCLGTHIASWNIKWHNKIRTLPGLCQPHDLFEHMRDPAKLCSLA